MARRRSLLSALLVASTAWSAAAAQTVTLRIGTTPEGGGFAPYSVALRETLARTGIGLEFLDTPGAAQLYNVLTSEGRRIA